MAARRSVKIEKTRELATAVPVTHENPPAVYLPPGPELRAVHVEILALRCLKQAIPDHLSMNDHIGVCGMRNVRRVFDLMRSEGVTDLGRIREFADRVIPVA